MILLKTAEPKAFHDLLGRGLKPTSLCRPGRAHQPIHVPGDACVLTHPLSYLVSTPDEDQILRPGPWAAGPCNKVEAAAGGVPRSHASKRTVAALCLLHLIGFFHPILHKQIVHLSYLVLSREISFDWHHLQSQSEIQKWLVCC